MGRPKALLPWRAGTFLSSTLELMSACSRSFVVAGAHAAAVSAYLEADPTWRALRQRGALVLVENPAPERGQFSSLQLALALRSGDEIGALCAPCDVPMRATWLLQALVAAHDRRAGVGAVIPTYDGATGHPVLLDAALFEPLSAMGASAHMREAIADALRATRLQRRLQPVDEPLVTANINTDEDYQTLLRRFSDA